MTYLNRPQPIERRLFADLLDNSVQTNEDAEKEKSRSLDLKALDDIDNAERFMNNLNEIKDGRYLSIREKKAVVIKITKKIKQLCDQDQIAIAKKIADIAIFKNFFQFPKGSCHLKKRISMHEIHTEFFSMHALDLIAGKEGAKKRTNFLEKLIKEIDQYYQQKKKFSIKPKPIRPSLFLRMI